MAEQQDRELIMIMSDASNSDSDEDEPVIVLADVSVTQPVRVLMSVLRDAKEEDIIKSSSLVLKVIENLLKSDVLMANSFANVVNISSHPSSNTPYNTFPAFK